MFRDCLSRWPKHAIERSNGFERGGALPVDGDNSTFYLFYFQGMHATRRFEANATRCWPDVRARLIARHPPAHIE
eukprot:1183541-Prorocentrum_minimum.AAC.3